MVSNATPAIVDVYLWGLDLPQDEIRRMRGVLSAEEEARAHRFVRPSDKDRWTVSRAGLRLLLARRLDVNSSEIAFTEEGNGRPALANVTSISFNLSHSADVAALAVSSDVRVGVDIEQIKPMTEDEVAWALSPAERFELSLAASENRLESFFRFWTLKEAFMKGTGLGAALPLHDFDMSLDAPRLVRLRDAPTEPARWSFGEMRPKALMRGAVAALTDGRELIANWRWTDFS